MDESLINTCVEVHHKNKLHTMHKGPLIKWLCHAYCYCNGKGPGGGGGGGLLGGHQYLLFIYTRWVFGRVKY